MNKSFSNLKSNIDDIRSLIALSISIDNVDQQRVIFRSVVVLLVATWEQFVEQLADSSIAIMTDRFRDPSPIPNKVMESVAVNSIPENRGDLKKFSDSVWSFAHKGWKQAYNDYCNKLTSNLHNASTSNVIKLFWKILGIRDITQQWSYFDLAYDECAGKLDEIIILRHEIAHGAGTITEDLDKTKVTEFTDFISGIAKQTFFIVYDRTAELSQTQGIEYRLSQAGLKEIIKYSAKKNSKIITLHEIKSLGSSAQGNHNKLCYEPWSLLVKIDRNSRRVSEKLHQFYKDELSLPLKILVFDNGEAIAKPGTDIVKYKDL